MDLENQTNSKLKCPWCPIETEDLTRLKEHLIRCRKGMDKFVYICKYYFGHLFQSKSDADIHCETCIYRDCPEKYPEHKRKIVLSKDNQYIIENENFPNSQNTNKIQIIPQVKIQKFEDPITNVSIQVKKYPENEVKQSNFISYSLHDAKNNIKALLTYSTGLSFKIADFFIHEYREISEFQDYFNDKKFRKEEFDRYATTFNYLLDRNQKLEDFFENDRIGYNESKIENNEVLIIISGSNKFFSKFFSTDFAILVVPASLLLDIPQKATNQNMVSFYRHAKESESDVMNLIENDISNGGNSSDLATMLCDYLQKEKNDYVLKILDDLDSTLLTKNQLNDLLKNLENILEDDKKSKEKLRDEKDQEYKELKSNLEKNRKELSDKMKHNSSLKMEFEKFKSSYKLDRDRLQTRYNKSLNDKLEELDIRFLFHKNSLARQTEEKENKLNNLLKEIEEIEKAEYQISYENDIIEKTHELEELKIKLKLKNIEFSRAKDEEKKIFEESNLTQGLKFEDFTCILCKLKKREIIFFPCRHFIACKSCSNDKEIKNLLKCDCCNHSIFEFHEVKFVNYEF